MLLLFAGLAENVKLGSVVRCRRAHAFLLSFCDSAFDLCMVGEDCGMVSSLGKDNGAGVTRTLARTVCKVKNGQ